jgi:type II secretory pathway component GspD/PulD (secretin)
MTNGQLLGRIAVVLVAVSVLGGCAASRAFRRGQSAADQMDWDVAVEHYRRAVQEDPRRAEFKIALERAMQAASNVHLDRARDYEQKGQLDLAVREYKQAAEFDASNRQAAGKVQELERTIRDRIEAARPRPAIEQLRENARQATPLPTLNPASRELLTMRFPNTQIRDILNFIGSATGINVTYDRDFADRPYSVELNGVTLEQALNQIMTANQNFYKVLDERTIIVAPDNVAKRGQYEEQVIKTFYVSHADVNELATLLNTIIRVPQMAVQPMFAFSKGTNTITVRATAPVLAIIERIIQSNDKPRAEIVIDVEILEVNRTRAKQYGLNLSDYAIGGIFSPESAPGGSTSGTTAPSGGSSTLGSFFNLNTVSQGISTADFYAAVPSAVLRFLESDSNTKLVAKPQLRGAEGEQLKFNLGSEIPVPSTTFTPIATGGSAFNPLTSFGYRTVGIVLELEPRVTFEGEIILKLSVESSTKGADVNIAGQNLPAFGTRKVTTRLRLRDGESNLLAGLLREDERRSLRGFPGAIHLPVLKQLFSANDNEISQTDIIMLLTPRIVRTHELTQRDVDPIYIGTQNNFGLGGPPPLIAAPDGTPPQPDGPPAAAPAPGVAPGQPVPIVPPGSSPIPGTLMPAPAQPVTPGAAPPAAPPVTVPPAAVPVPVTPPTPVATTPAPAVAQVVVTSPSPQFTVGGGPYTVPITVNNAARMSMVSLSLTYNPAVLRVRNVQEGSFLRQGGVAATFTQNVNAATGRIDITIARMADPTGASGSGTVAAVTFDAAAVGSSPLVISGVATQPGGAPLPLQFAPAAVTVR